MENCNQISYLIKGLQMKSKTLRKANAQALMNLLVNTTNKDVCEQIAKMTNYVDDDLCIICCYQLIKSSSQNEEHGNLQYLTNEKAFWIRIKRILTIERPKNDVNLISFLCMHHDIPLDFTKLIFALVISLCQSQNIALLKRNQSMLMKCKLLPFCELMMSSYPEEVLHTIEICTLESKENQLAFGRSKILLQQIKSVLQQHFTSALKSLINISSGNEVAVESLLSEIEIELIYDKLSLAQGSQLSLILGFLLNILEFRLVANLESIIDDILGIYEHVNDENTVEMTNAFLIEILLLYCCKYRLITILKVRDHIRIENTLQGINTLVKMGNRRWEGMQRLAIEITEML